MSELLAHIEAMNAETQKWVDAAPGRWAGLFHTDMDHWAEGGIHTVEDFNNMLDAEHEREMRKAAMYDHWADDEEMNAADDNYFNSFDDWCEKQSIEEDNAYEAWYVENQMKKYGVDTIIMIPTHYEIMANQAGFLEY